MTTSLRHRGLTLVEVCIAVAILAIVATVAVPSFHSLLERRRLAGWSDILMQDLRRARTEAVVRNEPVRMAAMAVAGRHCYLLHTGPSGACLCTTPDEPATCSDGATAIRTVWLPASGTVIGAAVASMLFDPSGTVTPTGTWHVQQGGALEVRHVVNLMGRIRRCTTTPQAGLGWEPC
jgi:type IV fimbrial biogenesis protein FimT